MISISFLSRLRCSLNHPPFGPNGPTLGCHCPMGLIFLIDVATCSQSVLVATLVASECNHATCFPHSIISVATLGASKSVSHKLDSTLVASDSTLVASESSLVASESSHVAYESLSNIPVANLVASESVSQSPEMTFYKCKIQLEV
ncbi:hypothetical protein Sjap_020323 [Stephania japonica]|uniref:Uncharacterized protein n=1 Tax=Stephania japonica TaxID=461633 RepID=A0AAP0F172_9MAGN